MSTFVRFCADETGAGAVEYGLIAACIFAAILTILHGVGTRMVGTFSAIAKGLD